MTEIKVEKVDKFKYKIFFNYTDKDFHTAVKALPSREYSGQDKSWILSVNSLCQLIYQYETNKEYKFILENVDREVFKATYLKEKEKVKEKEAKIRGIAEKNEAINKFKAELPEIIKTFDHREYLSEGITPYPHQICSALFLNQIESGILAADLGTGKTLATLLACEANEKVKKVLCIVPATLKLNWRNEVHAFTHSKAFVVGYKKNECTFDEAKYIIINYDYFNRSTFDFNTKIVDTGLYKCDTIIMDEAHKMSNKKSNTSYNIKTAFKAIVKRYFLLTATPMKNKLQDVFPLLKMVDPIEFSNESKFLGGVCGMTWSQWGGWEFSENTNLDSVYEKVSNKMYRVKKEDVLKDLPEMVKNKVMLEMSPKEEKEYKEIANGFKKVDWSNKGIITKTDDFESDTPLVILGRLRQYTASLKIKYLVDTIKELNGRGEKVVVFDVFKKSLYEMNDMLPNTKLYTGDQSIEERQDLVDEFQNENSDLMNLLVGAQVGNAGITLTAASNLFLITQDYVPSTNEQLYARLHRIGQKFSVNIYILLIEGTVDEIVYGAVNNKQELIDKVIDNEEFIDSANKSALSDILRELKSVYDN